ncbi:FKBP-type peptidyl-prolyl cis-trans isomerase [Propionicicella superfundia]|uniref:FKBP-type peptidyl-prolyl cis-trans isomerase n=1 Tax=Propionicicella superfundia TaxID=348582 RepID=UPI00041C86AC|nr:FKBP-type peptidyl-prolyl cis-trans isomerase [Propionicicella superfundia]
MSKARAVLIAGLIPLALSLAACASPSPSPTGTTGTTAGTTPTASAVATAKDLSSITVKGDVGATPTVTFAKPFYVGETMVKVLKAGTGRKVPANGIVKINYYGVNGRDGTVFDESFSGGTPAEFAIDQVITGFKTGLLGQQVGSRILIGIPGKDGYDANGGSSDGSIQTGDTILFVVDILDTSYEVASGTAVTPKEGLPTVTFADGKPTITIPDADPPATLQVQTLITGDGAKLTSSSTVLVKYTGVSWKTKEVVEENWTTGETSALSSLISGWQQGLPGQTVGSRVLLVIPPGLAYPTGRRAPKVEAGDTLVYVIDILYAAG